MENKINVAEILKDCPKGMELYSPIFGKVYLDKIRPHLAIVVTTDEELKEEFLYDGRYGMNGECMLFPSKGKTTWEGFVPPVEFKDGDIVFYDNCVSIFKEWGDETLFRNYVKVDIDGRHPMLCDRTHSNSKGIKRESRLATEEEKEKLFQAIRENGYRWNPETKTLEKLPKFKDGDILTIDDTVYIYNGIEELAPYPSHYVYVIADKNGLFAINTSTKRYGTRFATEEEKNILFEAIKNNGYKWYPDTKSLTKLIKPNFKVGDRIRNKTDKYLAERTIETYVEGIGYFTTIKDWVRINDQDNWELVPVVKPLYKVGDRIKQKNGNTKVIILSVDDWKYIIEDSEGICGVMSISTQDNWELEKNIKPTFKIGDIIKKKDDNRLITIKSILDGNYIITTPDLYDNCNLTDKLSFEHQYEYELVKRNKFNYSTLKPFDKVLVRDGDGETWVNAFFGFRDTVTYKTCTFVTGNENWCQCIPYEGNEHLLGTTDDCDEHFKTWES